ncbi:MAG: zinc ribbon domain-containing protein [Gammaproteobacteria bacterium]
MPMYEYHCEANGQTVEVVHRMSERYETWGELCEKSRIEPGDTPADAPVRRLIGGGNVNNLANATSKKMKAYGEASKNLTGGAMAAPPRKNSF